MLVFRFRISPPPAPAPLHGERLGRRCSASVKKLSSGAGLTLGDVWGRDSLRISHAHRPSSLNMSLALTKCGCALAAVRQLHRGAHLVSGRFELLQRRSPPGGRRPRSHNAGSEQIAHRPAQRRCAGCQKLLSRTKSSSTRKYWAKVALIAAAVLDAPQVLLDLPSVAAAP